MASCSAAKSSEGVALEKVRYKLVKKSKSTGGFRQSIPEFSMITVTKLKKLCATLRN